MLSYDELTVPERALWDAFPAGRLVDLRTAGEREAARTVRAEVIVALLLGGHAPSGEGLGGAVAGLRLAGARVTGQLGLAGAQVGHELWLEDCWFERHVDLSGATTRSLAFTGCRAPGLEAGLARVEGRLDLRGSRLEGGYTAPYHRRTTALSLINAQVNGAVHLGGARITTPGQWAVSAGGLVAEGGVYCKDGFVAHGSVRLMGSRIPGGLHMQGALLEHPGPRGEALVLDNAVISTALLNKGFTANGTVCLRGLQVADNLSFRGAVLNGPPGGGRPALLAPRMRAVDFDFLPARPPAAAVVLRDVQVSSLRDSALSWPDVVELEGFGYASLTSGAADEWRDAAGRQRSVAERLAWLRRSPGYSPQPYEQLAAWYRSVGHDDEARRVLLAKQRHRRGAAPLATRVWGHLLDVTVGYGYRPWLAGVWLLALTLLGTLSFRAGSPSPVKPGEGAPFQPLVYTLDLLIPIGGLGQRTAWYWPDGTLQWLAYLLIALGWILTTAVIAGVTRTLQKS